MKKVLIVSGQAYSKSNRSIDTITDFFLKEQIKIDHLAFGNNRIKPLNKVNIYNNSEFNQLYSELSWFSYLGKMGEKFPTILLKWIKKKTIETVSFVQWEKYDLIVLETGKPLFLLDVIPKEIPIICRQSDPLEISIRSDRDYFKEMEKNSIERSILTLVAHKKASEQYNLPHKTIEWKSGFEVKEMEGNNEITNSIVYMGMFKLDLDLIKFLALEFPEMSIEIIGNYEDTLNLKNVNFHGYLENSKYTKLIKKSKAFFIPYHAEEVDRMKKLGMTSKFYIPMSLGKPILSRAYGEVQSSNLDFNIFVYKNIEEAIEKLNYINTRKFYINKKINKYLDELQIENRKKELKKILKKFKVI